MMETSLDGDVQHLVNDIPNLTEEEKKKLIEVMIKAKELDAQEENKMRQCMEGQLSKYTNVVKGWQYRWFVLNPESGMFEYHIIDEVKQKRPRGAVHLAGAVISPSDEDSQTFTVSAACGEAYRLRASDAKERQLWVNRLRAVAEHHTQSIAEKYPPLHRDIRSPASNYAIEAMNPTVRNASTHDLTSSSGHSQWYVAPQSLATPSVAQGPVIQSVESIAEAFNSVRDKLIDANQQHQGLIKALEEVPMNGSQVKCTDTDLLLLKATSHAALLTLEQCFSILQRQQFTPAYHPCLPPGASVEWLEPQKTNMHSSSSTPESLPKHKNEMAPNNSLVADPGYQFERCKTTSTASLAS